MRIRATSGRAGSVLPLVVICITALVGFVAIAVDIGVLMVTRTECQHAADAAAMAGARTLNGDVAVSNNYGNAGPKIVAAATDCTVMNAPVAAGNVSYEIGYYTYNSSTQKFGPVLPSTGGAVPANQSWSLAKVTVGATSATSFAKIFGGATYKPQATATAVHRPRDICIVMDYSGSMSFDSLLGADYSGNRTQSSNPDDVYPRFGHYAGYSSEATAPYILSSGEVLGLSNTAVDTAAGTAIVKDFYQNNRGAAPVAAFAAAPDSYETTPGGDVPLRGDLNGGSKPYAQDVEDVVKTTSYHANWETKGYSWGTLNNGTDKKFEGYTQGPRYWGKTFFIWPPDPRTPSNSQPGDWRKRFFFKNNGTTPLDDNSLLWTTSSPAMRVPRSSSTSDYYRINYAAILRWLTATGPNPFPSQLRAGRIVYYTAIPDVSDPTQDAALNARFQSPTPADLNERFWKQYIDFALGFEQTSGSGSAPVYASINANVGYGDDFAWGTRSITAKPTGTGAPYMSYTDNPPRPKTRFWFGPMTLVDFIDNYNENRRWMPGTAHQAPLWACKVGMRAAMLDIEKNHPNDYVALSYFNTPSYSAGDGGRFNRVRVPLGRAYDKMVDCLFYPLPTINSPTTYPEINCYDSANMQEAPRADGATCPVMSFMHAYNQFAASPALANFAPSPAPAGEAGGLGRVGAQKVIIFMTDGVANTPAHAQFVNNGPYQSYYKIRLPGEYPSYSYGAYTSVATQLYGVAQQICNLDTNTAAPGYSTSRKPVLIHSIAYGSLFDPSVATSASAARTSALQILQQVQYIGSTQSDPTDPLPTYKIITGPSATRVSLMQQCFQRIMQDSISVTLIE